MIHLTLFTGIQYIKFTAVGERAVHITITKKICHNLQRTLSNCSCFTIFKRQVNISVSWLYQNILQCYPVNIRQIYTGSGTSLNTAYNLGIRNEPPTPSTQGLLLPLDDRCVN